MSTRSFERYKIIIALFGKILMGSANAATVCIHLDATFPLSLRYALRRLVKCS